MASWIKGIRGIYLLLSLSTSLFFYCVAVGYTERLDRLRCYWISKEFISSPSTGLDLSRHELCSIVFMPGWKVINQEF